MNTKRRGRRRKKRLAGNSFNTADDDCCRDASGEWGVRQAVDEFSENADRPLKTGSDGTWCIER